MKKVYKFFHDFGRMGSLSGLFVADDADVERLVGSGERIYYGEVLGKHSDISARLERSNLTMLSDDEKIVGFVERHATVGVNPFDYYEADEDEADEDEP